ncbi:2-oxoglutarate dehydrogenase, E2 component, dihydrolipoamide succinyltransferase [Nocardioides sp. zg-579]|uniref:Dihydrolipoamide acetyltransferase component of pyruvate dehydrogenase complex n=1 Tax=Nocardioides marmotae TaxID=2663857 RepID=A0A6I3JEI3_9ACTN|nr:2-oxoglutarate dehydrogenase, E2 component, dihydrolipoamide succinyltransferase [Nocardioides marmotae]MCR6032910.1 2-oxoglutarate dehydrogenase, E2 component, dihydrolipoamide succinyltransferase [Gordonia jinghuaiqii]MTB96560.1 2-oxoglutarate dehydrogenase, E2 component, dihydrolipoamide succinyltransferase [Nocardioides marmotae]QKE01921.1 2-oxoglutarate dehydrogenase, E2 component, dihydrolipoamide succinyltransferase [Nocardioides marmotae]
MATEVNLPALGESVTEGTVTRWLKSVGDAVAVDEPLLEVSTDKVDTEIPSPVAGTLLEIKAQEDDTVEVGAVLAVIGDEGESAGDASGSAEPEAQPQDEEQSEKKAEQEEEIAEDKGDLPAGDETPEADKPESPAASGGDSGGSGGGGGTPVTLPALGESVTEGTVTRWLKSVGDDVAVDEPLLEVSTDKVDTEIPSPVAGTLLEIKAEEDETVEVGAELAIIGDKGAAPQAKAEEPAQESAPEPEPEPAPEPEPEPAEEDEAATEQPEPEKDHEPAAETAPAPSSQSPSTGERSSETSGDASGDKEQARSEKAADGAGYVTPLVRKLAAQHDVDLSSVEGTGVGGRIRKQDVLDAAKAQQQAQQQAPAEPAAQAPAASSRQAPSVTPSPLRGTTEKISRLRKIIAERMVDSLQTGAQLTQVIEVDVTNIARLRDAVKADFLAREGVKLSYLPFFAKAAVDALKQHPKLNAGIDTEAGEITYYDRENLAIAVDTEKGLITPVVKDAGDLSIAGLAKKIADVAQRTRTNKIGPDELSGGTFTITNLGSVGALWDTPIINKPQVAILGPGAVVKRPVVIDDPNLGETIAVRHMVYLALTYDHRLVDGADAGRFLQDVKKRLEAGVFDV